MLEEAERRFQDAVNRASLVEHHLVLGNQRICLRFAGQAAAKAILPALQHLQTRTTAAAEFVIAVWQDTEFTPRWWPGGWLKQRSDYSVAMWNTCIASDRPKSGEQCLVDADRGRGYVCFHKREAIDLWKQVSPLRGAINAWFERRGAHVVHSAALGDKRAAVLLAGAGGSGKSTTSLQALADPRLYYLGDDLCLVDILAREPTVHCLYNTSKLTPSEAGRVSNLDFQRDVQWFPTTKLLTYLYPRFTDRLAHVRPLRAILLPRLGGERVRLLPASAGAAFRALAPSTLDTVPCEWRASLELLSQLSRRLPAYWLDLGPDRSQIADAIASFLASAPSRAVA